MIKITDEMKESVNNALANGTPCVYATASPDGEPSVSMRGSMMVWDDEHLAYWERSRQSGLAHIRENPKVVILYRDPGKRLNWRFHGVVTEMREQGPMREQVWERVVEREKAADSERKGMGVIIRVDRITKLGGQVLQSRDEAL